MMHAHKTGPLEEHVCSHRCLVYPGVAMSMACLIIHEWQSTESLCKICVLIGPSKELALDLNTPDSNWPVNGPY